MQTTYKEQIEAIQKAMDIQASLCVREGKDFMDDKQWLALNDAGSSIMVLMHEFDRPINLLPYNEVKKLKDAKHK